MNSELERMKQESQNEMQSNDMHFNDSSTLGDSFQPAGSMNFETDGSLLNGDSFSQIEEKTTNESENSNQQDSYSPPPGCNVDTKNKGSNIEQDIENYKKQRDQINTNDEPIWAKGLKEYSNSQTQQQESENYFQQSQQDYQKQQEPSVGSASQNQQLYYSPKTFEQEEQGYTGVAQNEAVEGSSVFPNVQSTKENLRSDPPQTYSNVWSWIKFNSITFIVVTVIMVLINLPLIDTVIQHLYNNIGLNPTVMNVVIMKAIIGALLFLFIHKLSTQ